MTEQIVLDLGEYGEILVESDDLEPKGGVIPTGRPGEKKHRKVDAGALLRAPLTGLAKLFMATLPRSSPDDPYELDAFSVEFEIGIEVEAGSNVGAVVKITPSGTMTCTYCRMWSWNKTASIP